MEVIGFCFVAQVSEPVLHGLPSTHSAKDCEMHFEGTS